MKRILVIRGGAIGDFILTLPAIKLLRNEYPNAWLEILGYQHIAVLAENRFYADAIRSIEYGPLAGFFAKGSELNAELARYFGAFDLIVSYLFDPDRVFEQNVARCGKGRFIACSTKLNDHEHAAIQLARPLEQLDLTLRDPAAQLYPSEEDRVFATSFFSSNGSAPIALHPGSGSVTKNWPVEKWDALMAALHGRELLLIGGEADERQLATLRSHRVRQAVGLPLPQLAATLEQCAAFLGHDSGISHIAAAVQARCVLLFGPTNPDVWAPRNAGVQIIRSASANLNDIGIEQVLEATGAISPKN